jgi:predicted methyltransferase
MHVRRLGRALLVVAVLLPSCVRPRPAVPTAPSSAAPPAAAARRVVASPAAQAVVSANDRSPEDRALDAGRHPAELLSFIDVRPGMQVAELAAGGGYTTELLARAVGPDGRVWAQNNRFILDRFAAKPLGERLRKPALRNVVRVEREFDDPLPPDVRNLDAVVIVLFYHDLYWLGADRDAMNRRIFDALRPGGVYAVVDHSARSGTGAADVKTLHRVEESLVRAEVERAGFRLVAASEFLKNPADPRDWNASPTGAGERRGTSDRFALLFVKPVDGTASDERRPFPATRPAIVESRGFSTPVATFLRRPLPATLVTLNPSGSPQASVMWYELRLTTPKATSSGGLLLASHVTKNASAAVEPKRPPLW